MSGEDLGFRPVDSASDAPGAEKDHREGLPLELFQQLQGRPRLRHGHGQHRRQHMDTDRQLLRLERV